MMLPSISLEDKIYSHNNTINAVIDYYNIEESRVDWLLERVKDRYYP